MPYVREKVSGMIISLIAVMDEGRVIGRNGRLPWSSWQVAADVHRFYELTLGKTVVMGRKTYESLPGRLRPLPGRKNIVLTRSDNALAFGCQVAHTIEEALAAAGDVPELMVIGGGEIYTLFLPLAQRMYLTIIRGSFEGDAYFPEYDAAGWVDTAVDDHITTGQGLSFQFVTKERK